MRTLLSKTVFFGVVLCCACATARPVVNIDPNHHAHLATAQDLTAQAWDAIVRAQEANRGQLGGHAERAKQLLDEANRELRLAADVSNAHGR